MAAFLTDSESCSVSKTDRDQAWSVSRRLLNLGRPSRPEELALVCGVSRDFVEFLCSIPDSPLCLTDDQYVTISGVGEFESKGIFNFVPQISLRVRGTKRLLDDVIKRYFRKRKGQNKVKFLMPSAKRRRLLASPEIDDDNLTRLALADSILSVSSSKAHIDFADKLIRNMTFLKGGLSIMAYGPEILTQYKAVTPLLLGCNVDFPSNGFMKNEEEDKNDAGTNIIVQAELTGSAYTPAHQLSFLNNEIDLNIPNASAEETREYELRLDLQLSTIDCNATHTNRIDFREQIALTATTCLEAGNQCDNSQEEVVVPDSYDSEASRSRILRIEAKDSIEEKIIVNSGTAGGGQGDSIPFDNAAQTQELATNDARSMVLVNYDNKTSSPERKKITVNVEAQAVSPLDEISTAKMQSIKSSLELKTTQKGTTQELGVLSESLNCNKAVNSPEQQEPCKGDQKCAPTKPKLKQNRNPNMLAKENKIDSTAIAKNQSEPKALPDFESFIIEEEEGSGGYGTVYRARRKNDGKTFAIKCPHVNAHVHHVKNELRMLERFGGRNFVIKYEGSFKSNNSECFVLEHVEHDRPEVLKRDIDIFELQWYGYCLFRALASLHKQGIVHRDVKPGNFLFCRKLNKGYLIDFNLAMDLHQKYNPTSKSKLSSSSMSIDHVPLPSTKSATPIKGRKVTSSRFLEASNQERVKDSKPSIEPNSMKKRTDVGHAKAYLDLGNRHKLKTQGADGSGITSTKDATSTRTASGERQREPVLVHGRKELLSFVEAMHSPNQKRTSSPASQRKRVAATPEKVDRELFYLTPMPVHSTGSAVAGAGLFKNKGDAKQKREGPCVGTKGFRAPEVLFRSQHQGPKVDVWSAGVTLLYLIIGRAPFVGDPEQNIKDIAKLRGSEELWEVAKLHNRESSFPVELFDIRSLPSMRIQDWCETNTKRPEFLDEIPRSLYDLLDKCLTVNPRLRISAEEALNHEFFAVCHERLRKQRQLRRGLSVESESVNPSQKHILMGL